MPLDVDELIDLLYVRRAIEPEAARHAALRATEEAMRAHVDDLIRVVQRYQQRFPMRHVATPLSLLTEAS